jgi:hypothetical protein
LTFNFLKIWQLGNTGSVMLPTLESIKERCVSKQPFREISVKSLPKAIDLTGEA